MNIRRMCMVGIISFLPMVGWSQAEIFSPMKDALKAGSAKELVKYFSESVDVELNGDERTYSIPQAELILREFFKKHPVTDFSLIHDGSSKAGLQYAIGKYVCPDETFTVLMRVKDVNKTHLIHEIKFLKETP